MSVTARDDATAAARAAILSMIAERGAGKTICPSEAARRLAPGNWRPQMPTVHAAAAALQAEGAVDATWRAQPVALAIEPGPYRLASRKPG